VLVPPVAAGSSPGQPEFSRHGRRDSERQTPPRSDGPHGDRSTAESHSLAARGLRPVASLAAAAAFHSSAACGQRAPLSGARTCPVCDSRAPNEPPSAGQRGAAEQSRLDALRAPTSEWLQSVVFLRLQNREVLQQGFPYPVRRSIPEKGSLYYAGFNRLLCEAKWAQSALPRWPIARKEHTPLRNILRASLGILLLILTAFVQAQSISAPPATPKHPVTDEYHGVKVTDDYR
jgi:hypothetical protein